VGGNPPYDPPRGGINLEELGWVEIPPMIPLYLCHLAKGNKVL
jgi:hypothetical protein